MARGDTRVDNGVETSKGSSGVAWHAPEGLGGAGQKGHGGRDGGVSPHGGEVGQGAVVCW